MEKAAWDALENMRQHHMQRIATHEVKITKLNATVKAQERKIAKLSKSLELVINTIQTITDSTTSIDNE